VAPLWSREPVVMADLSKDTQVDQIDETHFTGLAQQVVGELGTDGWLRRRARPARRRKNGDVSPYGKPVVPVPRGGRLDSVDIEVTTARRARTAEATRIGITQGGRPILE
jgi:hypothetical protein